MVIMSSSSDHSPQPVQTITAPLARPAAPRTILCLPGAGCPSWIFSPVERAVADLGVEVLAYDFLADDAARAHEDWNGLVARARSVLDSLGPSVGIVGHSMGAALAIALLAERPRNADWAVICSTGLSSATHKDKSMPSRLETGFTEAEMKRFVDSCVEHASDTTREMLLAHLRTVDAAVFRKMTSAQRSVDLTSAARRIAAPVVLCHGIWDQRRELSSALQMRAEIPDARLYLLDSGHSPTLEAPEEVAQLIQVAASHSLLPSATARR